MKNTIFFLLIACMMPTTLLSQTMTGEQVERMYKQAMVQLRKENHAREIHGKVYLDNSSYFLIKTADGRIGVGNVQGRTLIKPVYINYSYIHASSDEYYIINCNSGQLKIRVPMKPREGHFVAWTEDKGDIYDTNGNLVGSFDKRKGTQWFCVGNYIVYNYNKVDIVDKRTQSENPNNCIRFYCSSGKEYKLGVISLDGENVLPAIHESLTYYEASNDTSYTIMKDNMELHMPLKPHTACFVAAGPEVGGLYDASFNPLSTFPSFVHAKSMLYGNCLIYNYEYGGAKHEYSYSKNPLCGYRFYISTKKSCMGMMTTDGEEIFEPIYCDIDHNLTNHFIIVKSKAAGRQVEAGFNTEDEKDYVPLRYNSVWRSKGKDGVWKWHVRLKREDTLQVYNPAEPPKVIYANALDSLYDHYRYEEGLAFYRQMKSPSDYDKWIAAHCMYEIAMATTRPVRVVISSYKEYKTIWGDDGEPDYAHVTSLLTEAKQLVDEYKEKLGEKADYRVKAFPETLEDNIKETAQLHKDYLEVKTAFKQDMDEKEAQRRAKIEAAQKEREERIIEAWANALSGVMSTQVNRWISSSSSSSSSSSKQPIHSHAPAGEVSSSSSGSSSSSSGGELVTVEKHEKCNVCKGSGKITKSRGLGNDYLTDCPSCDGRGYKIRYENVMKK